jgi:hypothetical protein
VRRRMAFPEDILSEVPLEQRQVYGIVVCHRGCRQGWTFRFTLG